MSLLSLSDALGLEHNAASRSAYTYLEQLETPNQHTPADVAAGVQASRAALDVVEREAVRRMRAGGASWQEVARAVGITKQAAHARYRGL